MFEKRIRSGVAENLITLLITDSAVCQFRSHLMPKSIRLERMIKARSLA